MADKNIGSLPSATTLDDDSLLVAEQQGQAVSVSGQLIKEYAAGGVTNMVNEAAAAAKEAKQAVEDVKQVVSDAESIAEEVAAAQAAAADASTAQSAAEAAQAAAEQARDEAQAIAGGDFLPLAGGTMTGPITLSGDPTNDLHPATKRYVDNLVENLDVTPVAEQVTFNDGESLQTKFDNGDFAGGIHVVRAVLDATLWEQDTDSGLYAQTVAVTGVTGEDDQYIEYDVELTGADVDADTAALEAWAPADGSGPYSYYVTAGVGTLTFHASVCPSVSIPIIVGVG